MHKVSPETVARNFTPSQLTRAREFRGLTKKAVAEKVDVSPAHISFLEKGDRGMSADLARKLALALGLPLRWFIREPEVPKLSIEECHFRSLRSASQYTRRQVMELGRLVFEVRRLLEREIEFPKEDVSRLKELRQEHDTIESFAVAVRRAWDMEIGPIHSVIPMLEARGIIVLPLSTTTSDVDAFSGWLGTQPFMFLGMAKSSSRTHFDAAHELGHLLLHDDVEPGDPDAESEADAFAGAFLMPASGIKPELPSRWSLRKFMKLKRRWRASIAALTYRAYELGCISNSSYRYGFKTLSAKGMRTDEPDEWELDGPTALRDALQLADIDISEIADELGVHTRFLRSLLRQATSMDPDPEGMNIDPTKILNEENWDYRYDGQ